MTLDDRVAGVLAIPLHRFLGVRLADPAAPAAGIVLAADGPALNNVGVVHGGVVAALLDVAAYLAVLPALAPGENAVTHDASVSLLRSVAAGAEVRLTGEVLRRGRRLAFLRAEATVDDAVVATAQVTKSVVPAT